MIVLPRVEKDDVDQEAALLELQGKIPHRGIIYKRLARGEALYDEAPLSGEPLIFATTEPDFEVTQMLVDWALSQEEQVCQPVLDFLEEPTHEAVEELMKLLQTQGITLHRFSPHRSKSLTSLILKYLEQPRSLDDIYEAARAIHPSNRPEAAVRQILRRLLAEGKILNEGDEWRLSHD